MDKGGFEGSRSRSLLDERSACPCPCPCCCCGSSVESGGGWVYEDKAERERVRFLLDGCQLIPPSSSVYPFNCSSLHPSCFSVPDKTSRYERTSSAQAPAASPDPGIHEQQTGSRRGAESRL